MREIEIKVRVTDPDMLLEKLKECGCELSLPVRQHDVIYSKGGSVEEWKNSKEGDIILRIRRIPGKTEFNLKQQLSNESDNTEYETEVSNPEEMDNILRTIGYVPMVEVIKKRRKGTLDGIEVCFDEVEKLGTFIELEKLTEDFVDPEAVREELFQILESLGLSRMNEELKGYDTQIFLLSL